jgi:hypothetical protein
MVVHVCNPSTLEAEAESHEFKVILGYIPRFSLKKTEERGCSPVVELLPSMCEALGSILCPANNNNDDDNKNNLRN